MPAARLSLAIATLATLAATACTAAAAAEPPPRRSLARFESEGELKDWIDRLRKRHEDARASRAKNLAVQGTLPAMAAPAPAAAAEAGKAEDSVTNVQTAGVDEGGIVKVHGDHLVVLRRGRLFTVSLRDPAAGRRGGDARGDDLKPVSAVDAFGPGIDPRGAWYDELLIRGDTVIVIGFSYARGGTEVGLFDIDAAGALGHRGTWQLRSNDYYSSRNYASRLIGDKLIFYTPLYVNFHADPWNSFPAMRRWRDGAGGGEFRRIAPATRIYRTDDALDTQSLTLHTVTVCDLAVRDMTCEATGVLGPPGRIFYVSPGSVYVWTTEHRRAAAGQNPSAVFRIPLDGRAPTALKTSGVPIDQMSFLESDDGHLNVLLRESGRGEAMWGAESRAGAMALMRVSLERFGDGRETAPASAYRRVPAPRGHNLQNRFVGPWLLYGSGSTWGAPNAPQPQAVHALRWAEAGTVQTISIPHGVDRIEAMGRHALVVGTAGRDLHFSSVRLGSEATIPHRFTRENAAQGETRSHGFFYRADSEESGIVGLPVVGGGRPGHRQLRESSAAVMFLRNDALMLAETGELAARAPAAQNDGCRASCVDWYGNARPLFLRGRIFALLGYELVEGSLAEGVVREVRRASFAPR